MSTTKTKAKSHFTHKGKAYKPGDDFEGDAHEVATLARQGHVEEPQPQGQGPTGHPAGTPQNPNDPSRQK